MNERAKAVYAVAKLTDTCIEYDKQFDISIFNAPELIVALIIYDTDNNDSITKCIHIDSESFGKELDELIEKIKS